MPDSSRKFRIAIIILSILLISSSAFLFVSLEDIKQKDASIAAMSGKLPHKNKRFHSLNQISQASMETCQEQKGCWKMKLKHVKNLKKKS